MYIKMRDRFPKVSVLIPAFNRPHYLRIALNSVIAQTYPNIEIIIGDDSTDNGVEDLVRPYLEVYDHIKYVRNEEASRSSFGLANMLHLFEMATGEFINFLNDDDFFHPEKIEKMVDSFFRYPNVKLVTSYRQTVDEAGNAFPTVAGLFSQDTLISGKELGRLILQNATNYIGEPTTALVRKSDLTEGWAKYGGIQYLLFNDVATWMILLSRGDAVYIAEPLSYFRIHPGQNQVTLTGLALTGVAEWASFVVTSFESGFTETIKEYQNDLRQWNKIWSNDIPKIIANEEIPFISKDMRNKFMKAVEDLSKI
ncbi:glycosyltransferase involved in cell wall biosynthesis [Croceifilum oryzae]|uniref:Glycosyltransferase involved in cell wall biosynthesis n=1 Tax=Croceifilum oryzae TaxID=1553429 RepID=A0AAJ1TIU6_9BACL|nr:glycosyltransferase family 2 protein [Croceifilum oryzae]MDQ0417332.1 glycosyltransferase involved in cell wall biosynthesis [Croceifilum oryzae]